MRRALSTGRAGIEVGLPLGDYTPFGYLRNAGHRARSWQLTEGGTLRSSLDRLGLEWLYPTPRRSTARAGLAVEATIGPQPFRTRAELARAGVRLGADYHSALQLGLVWTVDDVHVAARLFLDGEDALCLRLAAHNSGQVARQVAVRAVGLAGGADQATLRRTLLDDQPATLADLPGTDTALVGAVPPVHVALATRASDDAVRLAPGARLGVDAVLARGPDGATAERTARQALARLATTQAAIEAEDAAFHAACPMLDGDWPAPWRAGLLYDFETTRLLVQPPGGIFDDVWPAWMAVWPRVVLAEGTLDMLRLAYADPALAQRAVLSMFRAAPQPNVPCVFFDGTPNMVAADGSVCGTSPAWCLPFLNLELLYLRTLDRGWLAALYPYACAYVAWWLDQRRDADGWIVYKCTWEAGEDGNPRLDPRGTGDGDISGRIRPVELQATLAYAARVLALFATELDRPADAARWRAVEADYTRRTQQLFDPADGRYRDWVLEPPPEPLPPYWGVDSGRWSGLGLTPLLLGLPLGPDEVWQHARPPWTLWPSWTYVLVESAAAAGLREPLGALIAGLLDHVYAVTTRGTLDDLERPLPGVSPEFWPLDWSSFDGSDAYGWGATTANLLLRHLVGVQESRRTDGWVVELAPALPPRLLEPGRRYTVRRLPYRGLLVDLDYRVIVPDLLRVGLDLGRSVRACTVRELDDGARGAAGRLLLEAPPAARHTFDLPVGRRCSIELR